MSEKQNTFDIKDLIRCVDFAARKHKNQRRKDEESTPYINHPVGNIKLGSKV